LPILLLAPRYWRSLFQPILRIQYDRRPFGLYDFESSFPNALDLAFKFTYLNITRRKAVEVLQYTKDLKYITSVHPYQIPEKHEGPTRGRLLANCFWKGQLR